MKIEGLQEGQSALNDKIHVLWGNHRCALKFLTDFKENLETLNEFLRYANVRHSNLNVRLVRC